MADRTPDGILKCDWNQLQELVTDYVNDELGSDASEEESIRSSILNYIDMLLSKYGKLPSLLATRADYVRTDREAVQLLEEAYQISENLGDCRNKTFISSSLAESYYTKIKDAEKGVYWTDKLSVDLEFYYDEDEYEVWQELKGEQNQNGVRRKI